MSCAVEKGPWMDLVMLRPHPPTVQAGPLVYGEARVHGGQRSVSVEYQTRTSAYLFDILVTGMICASP